MIVKDFKLVSRRVKRLNRVNVALGIVISFLEDLRLHVKAPTKKVIDCIIIPVLLKFREKVQIERSFLSSLKILKK